MKSLYKLKLYDRSLQIFNTINPKNKSRLKNHISGLYADQLIEKGDFLKAA